MAMPEPPYILDSKGNVREGATNRPGDERALRSPKADLSFVRIDHQARLQFEDTEVVIEAPFVFQVGEVTYSPDPDTRAELGPVPALYPGTLDATVDEYATLTLRFASAASITVAQDSRYEAWQVNGPGNYLVVCTPRTDGRLAVWT